MSDYDKIKCIFCDLDGTLFPERHTVQDMTELDVKWINHWLNLGKAFVIVTGRDRRYSYDIDDFFGRNIDYIGSNGATILHEGKEIYHSIISKAKMIEILDFIEAHDNDYELLTVLEDYSDAVRLKNPRRWMDGASKRIMSIEEYREHSDLGASKFVVITNNAEETPRVRDLLRSKFGKEFTIVNSSAHSVDVVNQGVDKWQALLKYCEILDYQLDEVAAIGNEENDYFMVKNTPLSFAIEGSLEKVLQAATYVVPSVHHMIKDYLLKDKKPEQ